MSETTTQADLAAATTPVGVKKSASTKRLFAPVMGAYIWLLRTYHYRVKPGALGTSAVAAKGFRTGRQWYRVAMTAVVTWGLTAVAVGAGLIFEGFDMLAVIGLVSLLLGFETLAVIALVLAVGVIGFRVSARTAEALGNSVVALAADVKTKAAERKAVKLRRTEPTAASE